MINTNPPLQSARPAPTWRLGRHARYGALTAYASVLAAAAIGVTLVGISRNLLAAGMPPLEIIFWRLLLAGALFTLHTLVTRRLPELSAWGAARITGLALLGFVPLYAAFMAVPIIYLLPALLASGLYVSLGTSKPLRKLNLLLAACLATLLLSGFSGDMRAALPPLLLGAGAASSIIFSRSLLTRYNPRSFLALAFPLAALALLPLLPLSPPSLALYLQLGLFALVSSYALYGLFYMMLKHLGVKREQLWATAEPAAALLVVLLLFMPAWPLVAGAALVMGAMLYGSRVER